jgi:hypothetical protein
VARSDGSWGKLTKAQQRMMNEVRRMWKSVADQGHAEAQSSLGVMYAKGQGVPQSDKEAAVWYRKAADQGHASAQYILGIMHAQGTGIPLDLGNALHWLQKAEAKKCEGAMDQVRAVKRAQAASPAAAQCCWHASSAIFRNARAWARE